MTKMQQLRAIADMISLHINVLTNQKHAFEQSKLACKEALDIIEYAVRFQRKLMKVTLMELETIASSTFPHVSWNWSPPYPGSEPRQRQG